MLAVLGSGARPSRESPAAGHVFYDHNIPQRVSPSGGRTEAQVETTLLLGLAHKPVGPNTEDRTCLGLQELSPSPS